MKILITGSLGNISKPLTKELVQKGHQVTVISSNPDKQKDIEALEAKAAIGSLEDVKFLTSVFTDADAVYTIVPPNDIFNQSLDIYAYYNRIGNNYAQAIKQSGVKRVVHLSSIGAHLYKGTGIILAHHAVEGILNNLSDVGITFMRPTAFYYNLYAFAGGIKAMGMMASNYGADDSIVWVSPKDIAEAISEEIITPLVGRKVRYVASEELTCSEVAHILGSVIGKPDLKWVVISNEQMQNGLEAFGMSKQFAAGLVEMNSKMHSGGFFDDYYLNKPSVLGKVKMKDFANDFAAAYLKA